MSEVKSKKSLTGRDLARKLGISYELAVSLPIPRLEIKKGKRTIRRYKEKDVLQYIEENTKVA